MSDGFKSCLFIIALVVILTLFLVGVGYIGFGASWLSMPTQMFSVDNTRNLSRQANDQRQALDAKLANINALESQIQTFLDSHNEDKSKWPQDEPEAFEQLQRALYNQKTAYNNECGKYKSMWADEWRSLPAPKDLETHCSFLQ